MIYEGEFEKGKMHGMGKMMFNNGMMYDGEWQGDMMEGEGALRF